MQHLPPFHLRIAAAAVTHARDAALFSHTFLGRQPAQACVSAGVGGCMMGGGAQVVVVVHRDNVAVHHSRHDLALPPSICLSLEDETMHCHSRVCTHSYIAASLRACVQTQTLV